MAHPRVIAQREEAARGRLRAALALLGAPLPEVPHERDPKLRQVIELETIAGQVEGLAARLAVDAGAKPQQPARPRG
jgi:hypothetical protein